MDLLHHPHIHDLLIQADNALQLLERADDGSRPHLVQVLERIYVDIGRTVHALRERPPAFTPVPMARRQTQAETPTLPPQKSPFLDPSSLVAQPTVSTKAPPKRPLPPKE